MTTKQIDNETAPWLWAGSMFGGFGIVAGLHMSGAIEGAAAWILYFVPLALFYPLYRSFARRAQGRANATYLARVAGLMVAYLVFLFLAERLLDNADPLTGPIGFILAALPALPIIGMFWAIGRLLVETRDEYQRMLLVRQILVGTALALAAATGWGFLELYGMVPHIPAFWWAIVYFAGQGLGTLINKLTYGDTGPCA